MKLIALLAALLIVSPAFGQQRQRPAAPAPQPPASGWTMPIQNFAIGYNATATRMRMEDRAVMTNCGDSGSVVRTCTFRVGRSLSVVAAAAEDRSALRDVTFIFDPSSGVAGFARFVEAFVTLAHHFEPAMTRGEQVAAVNALFDLSTLRNGPSNVQIGATNFSVSLIPNVSFFLSAERAN